MGIHTGHECRCERPAPALLCACTSTRCGYLGGVVGAVCDEGNDARHMPYVELDEHVGDLAVRVITCNTMSEFDMMSWKFRPPLSRGANRQERGVYCFWLPATSRPVNVTAFRSVSKLIVNCERSVGFETHGASCLRGRRSGRAA